jgi:hypothetical protein
VSKKGEVITNQKHSNRVKRSRMGKRRGRKRNEELMG